MGGGNFHFSFNLLISLTVWISFNLFSDNISFDVLFLIPSYKVWYLLVRYFDICAYTRCFVITTVDIIRYTHSFWFYCFQSVLGNRAQHICRIGACSRRWPSLSWVTELFNCLSSSIWNLSFCYLQCIYSPLTNFRF